MHAKALLVLVSLSIAAQAAAGVYYVNKGIKYHIGDNHYDSSEDSNFVGAYPVVGQEWIQAFKMDRRDKVRVDIESIWGVDDCPYCKTLISIDGVLMGGLSQENNHKPFHTPDPLARELEPGVIHYLKIASYGDAKVDDFVIENVIVQTDTAVVTLMQPGPILKSPEQPMPDFFDPAPAPKSAAPCESLELQRNWLHGFSEGRPAPFLLKAQPAAFYEAGPLLTLSPGEQSEFYVRVAAKPLGGDRVGQPFEILLGSARPWGWALLFAPGQESLQHGNLIKFGRYAAGSFGATWRAGLWNRIQVAYCTDGQVRLSVNGVEAQQTLSGQSGSLPLRVRSLGLGLEVTGLDPDIEGSPIDEEAP